MPDQIASSDDRITVHKHGAGSSASCLWTRKKPSQSTASLLRRARLCYELHRSPTRVDIPQLRRQMPVLFFGKLSGTLLTPNWWIPR